MNWLLIVFVGAIGAVADVVLSYWSYTHKLQWWLGGLVPHFHEWTWSHSPPGGGKRIFSGRGSCGRASR